MPREAPKPVEVNITAAFAKGCLKGCESFCPFSKPFFAPTMPPPTSAEKVVKGTKLGTTLSPKKPTASLLGNSLEYFLPPKTASPFGFS